MESEDGGLCQCALIEKPLRILVSCALVPCCFDIRAAPVLSPAERLQEAPGGPVSGQWWVSR